TFLLISFRIVLKDWAKAGILSSLIAGLLYSFGHVANALENWLYSRNIVCNISLLAWVWLFIFLILSFLVIRKHRSEKATQLLNLISGCLLGFTLFAIISIGDINDELSQDELNTLGQLRGDPTATNSKSQKTSSEFPDIYYIILDGYVRSDYLEEFFGYDNSPFLKELDERGFYNVSSSRSNYLNTNYSLNTSLNLLNFHDFPKKIFNKSKYNLHTNYLHDFLQNKGYQTVVFDSGTGATNDQITDIYISTEKATPDNSKGINKFELFFLRTTLGLLLFNNQALENAPDQPTDLIRSTVNQELSRRRERIRHALDHLPDYATQDGHYFLFSHIYLPHIPFLYGPDGEELIYHGNQNLYWYDVPQENYEEYYNYQIDYLNKAILSTVDQILSESGRPVVIVLQADHGDEIYLDRDAPTTQGIEVRSAILNAVYFSDGVYDSLYPTMTPVNTFRVVLNHWFGTQYPLLPDKVFFHEDTLSTQINEKPAFIDCCQHFNICLPPPPN
ncbi:MAG: hypothetical protein MUO54_17240, partial [Anaerolineales bacterium]|nr:hypothetical protein [Anaerolineales bacterium]